MSFEYHPGGGSGGQVGDSREAALLRSCSALGFWIRVMAPFHCPQKSFPLLPPACGHQASQPTTISV